MASSRWRTLVERREFLSGAWKWLLGMVGLAGVWTSWDVLRPNTTTGFGEKVKTISATEVPVDGVVYVQAARAYLTRQGEEYLALSEVCPHLSCRVPWCDSSGEFECPCHGSAFNRVGEYRHGPSPRGLDRFPVEIVDGFVVVDTGEKREGAPPGPETINEPLRGSPCIQNEE